MYNEWNHYEIIDGRAYAVVFREKGKAQIKVCPFCGNTHSHGTGGHSDFPCSSHCHTGKFFEQVVASDGTVMRKDNGYIIREV